MTHDYYTVLNIKKSASQQEVKTAFRTLAHTHHPDKGGDEATFKKINQAYQVLSNKDKRAQYDRYGSASQQFGGAGQGGFSGAQYYSPFGNAAAGQRFTMPSLKKVPLMTWIILLPLIGIVAVIGVIFIIGVVVRNVVRNLMNR